MNNLKKYHRKEESMKPKKHVITVLDLRRRFVYDHAGKALLTGYGAFERGLTSAEIDDYLRVRTNSMNVGGVRRKLNNKLCGSTCPVVNVNGSEVLLIYRHDVSRFVDSILDGTPTYFD
jgi:hypothetical protein